ncbi:Uncharacterized protein BM_BM3058 [Brugia malayi]|uniref:BMA-RSP-7 n=2 Tax=Brugia malayi TaxID=6279 RepID=A0A0H5S9U5_BRUMA|nr:Uncharacterized protein BM_BM3058 [Brugia malayi]CRZ24920.1 BMA-RSP-7 [Brugia malayi]VIO93694.1 Uncharacterized protein BM_BM3058 [Brugia malayi]
MGTDEPRFRVLHVSNISMTATREQIYQLFAFIGRIDEFKIYPSDNHPQLSTFTQKFAYVKFEDQKSVEVAQHLTNTVFIDRALVCIPSISDTIPDEDTALKTGGPAWPGQRQLPPNVVNQVKDLGDGQQMLLTVDPTLAALGLPPYPTLSANTEASKVEEIRRTVYVGNIPKDCVGDEVMKFFNDSIGEVMYLRMTSGTENLPCAYAYIEFTNQPTVPIALQNNGIEFKGRCLRIQHSRVAIIKPERKTADMALQEVEEAIRVNQNPDKSANALRMDRSYSPLRRSGSPRRHRSRSSSRRRRSRSRSKSRRRHRSKSKDRRSRSRSREHRRRSHSRHRRLSRSKDRKEKDKEKERREKEREKKERKRSKSRTPHKKDDRRERDKDKDRKEKDRESNSRRDKEKTNRSEKSDKKEEKDHDKGKKSSRKEKERERSSRKTDSKSSSIKAEVKLQIEHGESMEVDHPEQITASDETAMRERLMEKVLARNGPRKESMDVEIIDTDRERDEQQESKRSNSSDGESLRKKSRKCSKSSSSSSHSE